MLERTTDESMQVKAGSAGISGIGAPALAFAQLLQKNCGPNFSTRKRGLGARDGMWRWVMTIG